MKKTVFLTGASSGIGQSCARVFAASAYRLILAARRGQKLEELKQELEQDFGAEVKTLIIDVRDAGMVQEAIQSLKAPWNNIDILVNNAGLALGLDNIDSGSLEDWDRMIDTNIKGLLYVSRAIIPGMVERKSGHIINIGSIAGRQVYAKGNVYCATKHAVDAISQGMRIDLVEHGIKVSQVSPGATKTEFSNVRFHGDDKRAESVYRGYKPLSGDDVAAVVSFIASLPGHVNVDDLLLMPAAQAAASIFHKQ
jgi:3-hydroxy acid dehydrogenase / malonic semialdehyde reductase